MNKETSITKKCEICGEIKFIGDFSKSYKNRCKSCVAEHTRSIRALQKAAKTGAFGFTYEITSIDKQLALETIGASEVVLATYLFNMFKEFPETEKIVDGIIQNYKKEITEWLNDKTKEL